MSSTCYHSLPVTSQYRPRVAQAQERAERRVEWQWLRTWIIINKCARQVDVEDARQVIAQLTVPGTNKVSAESRPAKEPATCKRLWAGG